MAQVAANIMAGPARIFIGAYGVAVNPVSGTPPTLFAHTAGVPSGLQTGFSEVGYTTGPATFETKVTKVEIMPEQVLMAVDIFAKDEIAQLQFTAYERVYATLKAAFDSVNQVSDGSKDLYYSGGGTSIIQPSTFSVFMSVIHRDNLAKFTYACLYHAYSMDGAKMPFEKGKPTQYQVTFKALLDQTRSAGDQGYQFVHEK
jgi:hypothetical protein